MSDRPKTWPMREFTESPVELEDGEDDDEEEVEVDKTSPVPLSSP